MKAYAGTRMLVKFLGKKRRENNIATIISACATTKSIINCKLKFGNNEYDFSIEKYLDWLFALVAAVARFSIP